MRTILFTIPYSLFGLPIFGLGLLLLLIVALIVIALLRGRKTGDWSEEGMNVLFLLVTGGLVYALPRLMPGGLPVRGWGVMIVVAGGVGLYLACLRCHLIGLNQELVQQLAIWMFVAGLVGARVFYVIEYWESDFQGDSLRDTLSRVANFWQGGMVVYGSLIGATLAFFWFIRQTKFSHLAVADLIAPSLLIGLAIGRVGCLLNGCCFGGVSDLPWAITFPPGSPPYEDQIVRGELWGMRITSSDDEGVVVARVDRGSPAERQGIETGDRVMRVNGAEVKTLRQAGAGIGQSVTRGVSLTLKRAGQVSLTGVALPRRSKPVHPTQIYSTINAALLGWFLWSLYPFRQKDGVVTAAMLTIYPVTRILLEIIRTDESAIFDTGLSISQNISVIILVAVSLFWIWLWRQPSHNTA